MKNEIHDQGWNTLLTHFGEIDNAQHAHVMPIFQTSTFSFPDVQAGADVFAGKSREFCYSRVDNPNTRHLGLRIAALEALDIIRQNPDKDIAELVCGRVYGSGMAAISTGVLSCVKAGDALITQKTLYGNSYNLMAKILPDYGIKVIWVDGDDLSAWQEAFAQNPAVKLVYIETPANPTLEMVDIAAVSDLAHQAGAKVIVDNTFATPYCQRPFNQGADLVAHSTTKFLSGHGQIIGGALVARDTDFFNPKLNRTFTMTKALGGSASPFDAWLGNIGLKTFKLRMQQHVANARILAEWLDQHSKVSRVYYPGLPTDPGHEVAKKQMLNGFGAMISFELKGGFNAGVSLMQNLKLFTLAVSLGNVDSLIEHPASMTHAAYPPEERLKYGITDSLVRLSAGIEDVEDLQRDLDQALEMVG